VIAILPKMSCDRQDCPTVAAPTATLSQRTFSYHALAYAPLWITSSLLEQRLQ
jgi:hypothetical protein